MTKEDNKMAYLESCNLSKRLRKKEGLKKQPKGKASVGKIIRKDLSWAR